MDAVLAFHSLALHDFQYSIRMNHTSVSTNALLESKPALLTLRQVLQHMSLQHPMLFLVMLSL